MADKLKQIKEFPNKPALSEGDLLLIQSEGVTCNIKDAAVREYAADAAKPQVELAAEQAQAAAKSAEMARQYSGKPPKIQDGRWWIWNAGTQEYQDTGEAARGNLMYATFFLDPRTGDLCMFTDEEYTGPSFRLNGADLEVVLNDGN